MGIECGSQVCVCDLPVHLDTYAGCSHACSYCFTKRKHGIAEVVPVDCSKALAHFIGGRRNATCAWCDWKIPVHWGAMSDPFQPAETRFKASLKCLRLLAETGYPFVVSTKGDLIVREPYLSLFKRCRCVLQVSAASPLYDRIERGAPPFARRMEVCRTMAPLVPRVIVRIQPYIREALKDILASSLQRMRDAGAYGVVVEGMKYATRRPSTIKVGGDWCYERRLLVRDFALIRDKAHALGLRFFCGENRLRSMGDDACCCGIEGLEGFTPNRYNSYHLLKGDAPEPTHTMLTAPSNCFKCLHQDALSSKYLKGRGWAECMKIETRNIAAKGVIG